MIHFTLTPEQKNKFKKLKAAYKDCEKAGIRFVNMYGTLEAYDKSIVDGYGDSSAYNKSDSDVLSSYDCYCENDFKIPTEWTDDEHLIKLTPKGKELLDKREL